MRGFAWIFRSSLNNFLACFSNPLEFRSFISPTELTFDRICEIDKRTEKIEMANCYHLSLCVTN